MALRKNKLLDFTTQNTNEIWYWYGFITSDGSFNNNSLRICVNSKDEAHIAQMSKFFDFNMCYFKDSCYISIFDKVNVPILMQKLDLRYNKTYNPPDFNKIFKNDDQFYSFLTGFIDGDGTIEVKNDTFRQLSITLHSSWKTNLEFIKVKLEEDLKIKSKVIILGTGHCRIFLSKAQHGSKLRDKIRYLGVPYLKRKWETFIDRASGVNFFNDVQNEVMDLYNKGISLKDISLKLNVNFGTLKNRFYRLKNKQK